MTAITAMPMARKGVGSKADAILGIMLIAPIVVTMVALVFVPLIDTVWDSLHRVNPMQPGTPFVGLANYVNMATDSDVNTAWMNTFIYVVICVGIETVAGIAAAALINQVKFGRRWLLAAVVLPWALPGVVNAVIWMWIYSPGSGLLNGILVALGLPFQDHVWFNDRNSAIAMVSIVHIWRMMPLTVVIVLAAMQSVPSEVYEAARIDGANRAKMFGFITLPLIRGAIAIAMTNSTVAAFNFFDEAWVLTGPSLDTRPILIQIYLEAFQNLRFSYGMALSLVVTFVSLLVSLLYVLRVYNSTRYD